MEGRIGREEDDSSTKYAIGTEHENNGVGMWYGPVLSLDEVLNQTGTSINDYIFELNIVDGTKPIYRWTGERWRKV